MLKSKIGTNAGEIWQFLDTNGEKSISEIEKALSMKKPDVLIALGNNKPEQLIFDVNFCKALGEKPIKTK
jgi:hypothetical protein